MAMFHALDLGKGMVIHACKGSLFSLLTLFLLFMKYLACWLLDGSRMTFFEPNSFENIFVDFEAHVSSFFDMKQSS